MSGCGTDTVSAVRMPQVNVNDDEVRLVGWLVADGGRVEAGQPLCEVETSKAVGEVPAPAAGVVRHAARLDEIIAVGDVFAYIGPSIEEINRALADAQPGTPDAGRVGAVAAAIDAAEPPGPGAVFGSPRGSGTVAATAGAIELARRHGVDLARVPATGRIRRSDVERYLAVHRPTGTAAAAGPTAPETHGALPPALADKVCEQGELSDHQWSIAQHLARTQAGLVVAHVAMDVPVQAAMDWIRARRQAGVMTGLIPLLLHAAAAAAAAHNKLASFRLGRRVYQYRSLDIAYTARSRDGRLFTPVVRAVSQKSLDELAAECARLGMAVFRGSVDPRDLQGGCLTVSVLSEHPVRWHVGLQNAYQSALLTAGAIRQELALVAGEPVSVPTLTLTLSYDHGLMDGWEAAAALASARAALEAISA